MDRPLERKKRFGKAGVGLGLLALAGLAGYVLISRPSTHADQLNMRLGLVKTGHFSVYVVGNGNVVQRDVGFVLPKVAGDVLSVEVESGDRVEEGQILFLLENAELDAELASRKIEVAEAKASMSSKRFELESQNLNLKMEMLKAESKLKIIEEKHHAQGRLINLPKSPVPALEYRQTTILLAESERAYELEKIRLANYVESKVAQLDQYQAKIDLAEAALAKTLDRVGDLRISAKRSGIIQDVEIKSGQRVEAGAAMGMVSNPSDLFIQLKISAVQGDRINVGQSALIDVYGSEKAGTVVRIDPNVKGTTIEVDIKLAEAVELRNNMFVSGRIIVKDVKDAVYVEAPARLTENQQMSVYVLEKDNVAVLRKIKAGYLSGNDVMIEEGLEPGEKIIVSDTSDFGGVREISLR